MPTPDTIYAIDYDGVLGDVRQTVQVFFSAVALLDETLGSRIKAAQKEVEDSGGSFDVWGFVKRRASSQAFLDELENSFKVLAKTEPLLYEDAQLFMEQLARAEVKYFILTTGGDKWQQLKLEASGMAQYPYLVTDRRDKGKLIRSWWQEAERLYRCPALTDSVSGAGIQLEAPRFVLVEDKPMGFEQFPQKHAQGYLLRRKGERLKASQKGSVPKNVEAVNDLQAVLAAEDIGAYLL